MKPKVFGSSRHPAELASVLIALVEASPDTLGNHVEVVEAVVEAESEVAEGLNLRLMVEEKVEHIQDLTDRVGHLGRATHLYTGEFNAN